MKPSKRLTNKEYFAVMERSRGRCWYCGKRVWPNPAASVISDATIDHVHSTAAGGNDDLTNLVCACRACNSAKCNRGLDEFRHVAAIKALGMPRFSRRQIAWIRDAGADLSAYDNFRFWFESHKNRHTRLADSSGIETRINGL